MRTATLIKRVSRLVTLANIIDRQDDLIKAQAALITNLERQLTQTHRDYLLEMRGMVGAWIISQESPEIDLRDELALTDQALADRAAVLEEYLP